MKCDNVSWIMAAVGIFLVWLIFANDFMGSSGLFKKALESFTQSTPASYCPDGVGANFGSTCDEVDDSIISSYVNAPQSPEQCGKGSSYSGSGGCLVLSDTQKHFIATRGGNRTTEASDNSF
jgi:hypothetical protein